jgi:hypothetical protein
MYPFSSRAAGMERCRTITGVRGFVANFVCGPGGFRCALTGGEPAANSVKLEFRYSPFQTYQKVDSIIEPLFRKLSRTSRSTPGGRQRRDTQRATCPPRAAVRQLFADIAFNWPRLARPALALRRAAPEDIRDLQHGATPKRMRRLAGQISFLRHRVQPLFLGRLFGRTDSRRWRRSAAQPP